MLAATVSPVAHVVLKKIHIPVYTYTVYYCYSVSSTIYIPAYEKSGLFWTYLNLTVMVICSSYIRSHTKELRLQLYS